MKINLITMHRVINYGSVLQTYATVKFLENIGYEVEVIDYIPERFRTKNILTFVNPTRNKSIFHKVIFIGVSLPGRLAHLNIFSKFINNNYSVTKEKYYTFNDLVNKCPKADIYITGSDQVWNSGFEKRVDRAYFLDFAPKDKKRIAYAASFGKSQLDDYEIEEVSELLNKYNHISVREDSALKILKDIGIENTKHVVDPTLLLSKEEWEKKSSPRMINDKYVLIYQLNPSDKLIKFARQIADKKGLKVAKFGWDYVKPKGVDINLSYKKPEEFLSSIKYADFIVTDSFHGTIFSLKFNKKFICIAPPKYSTRLESILRKTNLQYRMIKGNTIDLNQIFLDINYEDINNMFSEEVHKSKEFICNSIKN